MRQQLLETLQLVGMRWVCQRLNVSEATVRRWADEGLLPTTRIGGGAGERVFERTSVEQLARTREQKKAAGR